MRTCSKSQKYSIAHNFLNFDCNIGMLHLKSKTQKYSIAHNFFNFDHNIGMLHLKSIVLKRGIHLNKNILHLTYPVLTTTQNDEKIAHCGFQFFSHHFYMGILYTDEMNVSEQKF